MATRLNNLAASLRDPGQAAELLRRRAAKMLRRRAAKILGRQD
ncbi:hypothetical protein ACPPVO_01920 [Dactylosporangium sp. McL0621]